MLIKRKINKQSTTFKFLDNHFYYENKNQIDEKKIYCYDTNKYVQCILSPFISLKKPIYFFRYIKNDQINSYRIDFYKYEWFHNEYKIYKTIYYQNNFRKINYL